MKTIRARMITIILGVICLCWVALVPLVQSQTRTQIDALMLQRAEYTADTLLMIMAGEAEEEGALVPQLEEFTGPTHHYESEPPFPFAFWLGGQLRARTASGPDFPQPSLDTPTWSEVIIDGEEWRVVTRHRLINPSGTEEVDGWTVVGVKNNEFDELAASMVLRSNWPLFVSLPILAIVIYFGIGFGLRPLNELARQISRRSPDHLEPVSLKQTPGEVIPMVKSLNQLFAQVQRAFSNEVRFTADAAHELRTPLSALSAQAQLALQTENDDTRDRALRHIIKSVDHQSHLVTQLLTLARLDPKRDVEGDWSDLAEITRNTMAQFGEETTEKRIDFSMETADPVYIFGDEVLLSTLIRNLIDNAVKFSPEDGRVSVSVFRRDEHAELRISDTGPGIPPDLRESVVRRFYRINESDTFGTGLGLSIVDRIAALHKATVEFTGHDGPGLTIVVKFPVADTESSRAAA